MWPGRALLAAAALTASAATARASTVRRLSQAELESQADVIVEGRVGEVSSRWNEARTGLETTIVIDVTRTVAGEQRTTLTITQPGGELAGDRHIIAGMPTFVAGEEVRVYAKRRPDHRYRVLGWGQGKWVQRRIDGQLRFVPSTSAPLDLAHYSFNGLVWPPAERPVQYFINEVGSDDVSLADATQAIFDAFATWEAVPCSSLSFSYQGETALGMAVDDVNVVMWIESGWVYGEEAAGAASIWAPAGGNPTVDVALNGEHFGWAIGVPGVAPATQDVIGVLTHELGHFSGLSHTQRAIDTMYYSWTPWQSQRSLSADDKLGLCELYPQNGDECSTGGECDPGATCESYPRGTLCTPQPDAIGDFCNYDRVECEHFCLFTAVNLSSGYCSRFCQADAECGPGYACRDASAGGMPVKVCFVDPSYVPPDASPGQVTCSADEQCPPGWYCGDTSLCARDCRLDIDCNGAGQRCDTARGRCVDAGDNSGCGCRSAGPGTTGGLWLLLLLVACAGERTPGSRRSGLRKKRCRERPLPSPTPDAAAGRRGHGPTLPYRPAGGRNSGVAP